MNNQRSSSVPQFDWYAPARGDVVVNAETKTPINIPITQIDTSSVVIPNATTRGFEPSFQNQNQFISTTSTTTTIIEVELDSLEFNSQQSDVNSQILYDFGLREQPFGLTETTTFPSELSELILPGDKWNFSYSRRTPSLILDLEEQERKWRMSRACDAVLFGKWHRVQLEFMRHYYPQKLSLSSLVAPIIAKEEVVVEITQSLMGSMIGKASHIIEAAKDKFGYPSPSSIAFVTKAEEKERIRRMNEGVDPMFDARKRAVESELLHKVKSV
jgi:hypothetical protein